MYNFVKKNGLDKDFDDKNVYFSYKIEFICSLFVLNNVNLII